MILNTVLTGDTFWHLRYFVCSLIEESDAQFRLVTNGCTPRSESDLRAFAEQHSDRVVEVFDSSPGTMVAHGVALDAVFRTRNDGELFAFVDPDIMARGPFLPEFRKLLNDCDAVTSGRELWSDDNVLPAGQVGVGGRHFYDENGFVFGSPHFAIYRRNALAETFARWHVGLGSAGPDLEDRTRARIADAGHDYLVYDTGKIANILFQLDGNRLVHYEHPELLHIGGLSHFLSPGTDEVGGEHALPSWAAFEGMSARAEIASYTARVLRAAIEQRPVPELPQDADVGDMRARLEIVRREMPTLVSRYREC